MEIQVSRQRFVIIFIGLHKVDRQTSSERDWRTTISYKSICLYPQRGFPNRWEHCQQQWYTYEFEGYRVEPGRQGLTVIVAEILWNKKMIAQTMLPFCRGDGDGQFQRTSHDLLGINRIRMSTKLDDIILTTLSIASKAFFKSSFDLEPQVLKHGK